MIEIELPLRCPFCGGKAEVHNLNGSAYFVKCSKCKINQDKLYHQRCDAVKAWNKRVKADGKDINATTNADRIRAMSDEELAKFFDSEACLFPWCDMSCGDVEEIPCRKCIFKWLKQECAE